MCVGASSAPVCLSVLRCGRVHDCVGKLCFLNCSSRPIRPIRLINGASITTMVKRSLLVLQYTKKKESDVVYDCDRMLASILQPTLLCAVSLLRVYICDECFIVSLVSRSSFLFRLVLSLHPVLVRLIQSRPVVFPWCPFSQSSRLVPPRLLSSFLALVSSCSHNPPSNGSYPTVFGEAKAARLIVGVLPGHLGSCPAIAEVRPNQIDVGVRGCWLCILSLHSSVESSTIKPMSQMPLPSVPSDLCCAQERLFPCLCTTVHLASRRRLRQRLHMWSRFIPQSTHSRKEASRSYPSFCLPRTSRLWGTYYMVMGYVLHC